MARKKKRNKYLELPGFDGAKITVSRVRLSGDRSTQRSIRARPGTFEWVYGRDNADTALYHAGIHYAELWETAGTADARSPDFGGSRGPGWKGLPDRRCDALSELNEAFQELGEGSTQRLTLYCVRGKTAREIAGIYEVGDREMALVLKQDLRDCARHFRFLSVPGVDKLPKASYRKRNGLTSATDHAK